MPAERGLRSSSGLASVLLGQDATGPVAEVREVLPKYPVLSFAEELRQCMQDAGLSQNALARNAGVDHTTISRLLRRQRSPGILVAAVLVKGLAPDSNKERRLVASLANVEDKEYIDDLLGLSYNSPGLAMQGLDTRVSKEATPIGKAIEYRKRSSGGEDGRSMRLIAAIGGVHHTSVSRFFSGQRNISGSHFIALVKGLGLTTRQQVMDFFYSFARQKPAL